MSWAGGRRLIIALIVGAVIIAFLATILISVLYQAPSCTDNRQNQDETGIDCGGSCPYLCVAEQIPPTVLFTKAFTNSARVTEVVADVENKNLHAAARSVPYKVTLYGENQTILQEVTGSVDLPPGATIPVFIPGISLSKEKVTSAFLTIDASKPQWFTLTGQRVLPIISNSTIGGSANAPRVQATVSNPTVIQMNNIKLIVFVRDDAKEVIAASQTLVPSIAPQGSATAVFTWNDPFSRAPATIQVVPIIPLP